MRPMPDLRLVESGSRTGFTIVEAVISMVIVAVMLTVALNVVGASRLTQQRVSLVNRGHLLADALLSEVLAQDYQEPVDVSVFGRESGEAAASRTNYDDVDDYAGWSSSPPLAKDGTILANSVGWKRTVQVEWVGVSDPGQIEAVETGVKRVTVTAEYGGVPQARLVALRTADP